MNATHTPGPWKLVQFGGPQISGPDGYAICTMWGGLSVSELPQDDAANARLIAAAPDLLAALGEVKWRSADRDNMEFAATITYSQMAAILVAIEKATGQ